MYIISHKDDLRKYYDKNMGKCGAVIDKKEEFRYNKRIKRLTDIEVGKETKT